jgi:hypothetical protein
MQVEAQSAIGSGNIAHKLLQNGWMEGKGINQSPFHLIDLVITCAQMQCEAHPVIGSDNIGHELLRRMDWKEDKAIGVLFLYRQPCSVHVPIAG